jgi:hypothetical protein
MRKKGRAAVGSRAPSISNSKSDARRPSPLRTSSRLTDTWARAQPVMDTVPSVTIRPVQSSHRKDEADPDTPRIYGCKPPPAHTTRRGRPPFSFASSTSRAKWALTWPYLRALPLRCPSSSSCSCPALLPFACSGY